jgi:hypothetical protein
MTLFVLVIVSRFNAAFYVLENLPAGGKNLPGLLQHSENHEKCVSLDDPYPTRPGSNRNFMDLMGNSALLKNLLYNTTQLRLLGSLLERILKAEFGLLYLAYFSGRNFSRFLCLTLFEPLFKPLL